jgi:hypothetical protein
LRRILEQPPSPADAERYGQTQNGLTIGGAAQRALVLDDQGRVREHVRRAYGRITLGPPRLRDGTVCA